MGETLPDVAIRTSDSSNETWTQQWGVAGMLEVVVRPMLARSTNMSGLGGAGPRWMVRLERICVDTVLVRCQCWCA